MKYIWEFFEDMNEIVYVSDMETNELVYMNAYLRKALGCSNEDYIGKKCYEVLQGEKEPCSFCTNSSLEPGKFISWAHKNPVMKKSVLVKDTMLIHNNRKYRIEIAIDMDAEAADIAPYYYARSETILNECVQRIFSTMNPEDSIEKVLAYIGETFLCDRSYIFEVDDENGTMSNTYEWCRQGVMGQKNVLQQESTESVDWWLEKFKNNKMVVIKNIEDIRTEHSSTYAVLKPQAISALVVGPIHMEDTILGFIGVDNPENDMINLIAPLLNIIGYFMASLLKRRDLLNRLNNLSFHDSLTGAFNRNAMSEHHVNHLEMEKVGIVYCDITGLKRTNDSMGHDAGDEMIRHCYNLIREVLETDWIYRTGGDEFVSVMDNCEKDEFLKIVEKLRNRIKEDKHHIAVGYAWSDQQPFNLEVLISEADKIMYEDKRKYYADNRMISGVDRRHQTACIDTVQKLPQTPFNQFFEHTYHDVESLFQSISQQNASSYFYFGDMQKDIFYISDNMKNDFGFESNVVPSITRVWAQHITTPKFKELYWNDYNDMLQNKRTIHDLRYQVRNVHGKKVWVHCYGIMKWNEDKSMPLFFSGRVTHQDNEFVVDPITNFPRIPAVLESLNQIESNKEKGLIIGFSFNNITEINNTRGRSCANRLLKNISDSLMEQLSEKMSFYRLEGMRCIALVDAECKERKAQLVQQIREIIEGCYNEMGISVRSSCSFGLIEYPNPSLTTENFLEQIVSLIRVAKNEINKAYIEYTDTNIQRVKEISNAALTLNQDVVNGMENFRIVIQPVVSVEGRKIIGGEVLLRWTFEGKDVSPTVFIPMLERDGMIHSVGRWVFEQTVRSCVRLVAYIPDFYLTFNVSLHQLTDSSFTEFMKKTLEKYHLDGKHIIAEMTETCLDEQPEKLNYFVEMCTQMGVSIALDDFGSGYSSLRMLLRYPCSMIKLDRSLLQEMTDSDQKMQFISSIVYACHQFGKKVCAEGVENQEQDLMIQDTACDMIQGYYYYRPMEVSDLYHLLGEM